MLDNKASEKVTSDFKVCTGLPWVLISNWLVPGYSGSLHHRQLASHNSVPVSC